MRRTPGEAELFERFRDFGLREVRPGVRRHDDDHAFDLGAWKRLAQTDIFRLPVRAEWGGLGAGLSAYAAALEGLAEGSGDLGFGVSVVAHVVCLMALAEHGTDEQRALYLPRLLSGEWIGAVANAEPQAGTNLMALASRAAPCEAGFELTAEKQSITNVGVAHLAMCSARLAGVPPRKEVNVFLVETAGPGVQAQAVAHLAGLRSSCTGDLRASRAPLPSCALLGGVGKG